MPIDGPIPGTILTLAAAATLFTVMFDLGLAIVPGEFRWVVRHPALVLKALFAVLIAVPVLALVVSRAFDLTRPAEVGVVLMAISPGAPVALRRSLDSGGHSSFAPTLQIAVVVLAVVSMPLFIGVLNEYYGAAAVSDPLQLARQVFVAQLLPLSLGMVVRRLAPRAAAWLEPRLRRLGGVLLIVLLLLVLVNIWRPVVGAGWRVAAAIATTTTLALAVGTSAGRPAARDTHGDGHLQRRPQSRPRPSGRDAQRGPAGHHRDRARVPRRLRARCRSLRDLAQARGARCAGLRCMIVGRRTGYIRRMRQDVTGIQQLVPNRRRALFSQCQP